jgi:AcrR family transcriptional regulator
MARKKEYIENEVIEKAMALFWRNGFETTSMQMLEKEMGINKFSIYSSFGNKNGVLLESIKCYRKSMSKILDRLEVSNNGVLGLKQYFYDFITFSQENNQGKGCLMVNTANELGGNIDPRIQMEIAAHMKILSESFANNLKQDTQKDAETIANQTDFLLVSKVALASASKMFNNAQMSNYIENLFKSV